MATDKTVAFDRVHDTGRLFRELLQAFARPGHVRTIAGQAGKIAAPNASARMVRALAYTLLDGEVRFSVKLPQADGLAHDIQTYTFARQSEPDQADYIFADGRIADAAWSETVRTGSLAAPERSGTVVLEVDELTEEIPAAAAGDFVLLRLTGPGIETEKRIGVGGLAAFWLRMRDRWNAEYPMGADMVLFTGSGQIVGLPRTTRVEGA